MERAGYSYLRDMPHQRIASENTTAQCSVIVSRRPLSSPSESSMVLPSMSQTSLGLPHSRTTRSSHKRLRVATKTGGLGSRLRSTLQSIRGGSGTKTSTVDVDVSITQPAYTKKSGQAAQPQNTPKVGSSNASRFGTPGGTLRRLRASALSSKTLSFPPTLGEPLPFAESMLDDFVFVTPDMYAATIPTNVRTVDVNGIRFIASDANSNAGFGIDSAQSTEASHPRSRRQPKNSRIHNDIHNIIHNKCMQGQSESRIHSSAAARKNTLNYPHMTYASTDSLPSTSSSSLSSLPPSLQTQTGPYILSLSMPTLPPLLSLINSEGPASPSESQTQSTLSLTPVPSAGGATTKCSPKSRSARKVSETSLSSAGSLQENNLSYIVMPEDMEITASDMYKPNIASTNTATHRRRTSATRVRRHRTMGSPLLGNRCNVRQIAVPVPSVSRARSASLTSRSSERQSIAPFNFSQPQPALDYEVWGSSSDNYFWLRRDVVLDSEMVGERVRSASFPSDISPRFDFELGMESDTTYVEADRRRAKAQARAKAKARAAALTVSTTSTDNSLASATRNTSDLRVRNSCEPSGLSSTTDNRQSLVATNPNMNSRAWYELRGAQDARNSSAMSSPEQIDYDGLTLTQPGDWLLMDGSTSDDEQLLTSKQQQRQYQQQQHHLYRHRYRNRRRTGLDPKIFASTAKSVTEHNSAVSATGNHVEMLALPATDTIKNVDKKLIGSETDNTKTYIITGIQSFDLVRIPHRPFSLKTHIFAECVSTFSLKCHGITNSWQPVHIPHFECLLGKFLEQMHSLKGLALVNLGLTAVPLCIAQCKDLQNLNLMHNWISVVPGWISCLSRLKHIRLAGNPISAISADIVAMRENLATFHLGRTKNWKLLHRGRTLEDVPRDHCHKLLCKRLERTATKRMASMLESSRLTLTPRHHELALDRATKLFASYANIMYTSLHEPRAWGHSVALPYPDSPAGTL